MSASLLVDLGNTCLMDLTINPYLAGSATSGTLAFPRSGAIIGDTVDMLLANTYTNMFVAGTATFASGQLRIAVQTAPSDVSGQFTDPTSGLAAFPTSFESGGILRLNSGGLGGGLFGPFVSGQSLYSGFVAAGAFQRPNRFVRAIAISGETYCGPLAVGFIGQLKTTGSGAGFTMSPSSGAVSV